MRRASRLLVLLLGLLAATTLPARAADDTLYAITNNSPFNIYTVNPATGVATSVGNLSFSSAGLARNPLTGVIFYTAINPSAGKYSVATWDPATSTNTTLSTNLLTVYLPRVAFKADGTLYGMDSNNNLYTLNTSTGAILTTTAITGIPTGLGGDMAFSPTGTLYVIAGTNLYTISGTTATLVGNTGITNTPAGLAFGDNGTLYTSDTTAGNSKIYTLSTTNGAATLIGSSGTAISDLASLPKFANLSITKSASGSFIAGTNATYTLSVSNAGPQSASAPITVTDTLPSGETFVSGTGTGWTCSASGQTVTCTNSSAMASGASSSITLTVALASNIASSVTNTASVDSNTFDPNTTNNSSSVTTSITYPPDLTVSKTHTGNFTQGQSNASYTITVTNSGSGPTTSTVTVTDTLPSGLTYSSATGTGWTCSASGQTVTCTNSNTVAAGASFPAITLNVTVSATAPSSVTNSVSVSGGGEINTGNDSASDATTINQLADLTIAKTHSGNFTQGQTGASYTLTVTNSGNGATDGSTVTVTDTLPASLTSPSGSGTGWSCSTSSQTVTCTRSTVLAAGASYPAITITANVSATAPSSVTNSASVSGGGEIITNNDSASDATTINQLADLTITKSHTGNFTQGQSNASYTLTVTNSGNGSTSGTVTVTDTLPSGLTYSSASGTGWSCSASGQTITCTNSNTLSAGASFPAITLNVNVSATAPSSLTNSASVSGGGEIITNNDSSSDATTINQLADMTVAKSHTGNFTRGSTGVYTITATNSGPTATSGTVTVTDTLPSGLTYSSATGTGWTCSASGQTVTCTRSDALAAGASFPSISLTVNVAQSAASSITNSASASGGGQANTSNDSASDATTIVSSADLSLTNVVTSSGSGIGTNATFTVTLTNSGPSNATNVAVLDLLPSGLTYVSSTPSTGTYNSTTGVWTVASLASGSSATLQLVAQISSLGSITNTAEVTASDQPDPDSTPNNHVATEDDQASSSLSTSPPNVTLCKTIQGQPCPPTSTPSLPPGSDISYVITFTNTGGSYASSFVISDPVPANTDFKVGSATTTLGTTGLTVTISYSDINGWGYTPTSGGGGAPAGYDRRVTNVRWSFSGNLSQTSPNNSGSVGLTVRIR